MRCHPSSVRWLLITETGLILGGVLGWLLAHVLLAPFGSSLVPLPIAAIVYLLAIGCMFTGGWAAVKLTRIPAAERE